MFAFSLIHALPIEARRGFDRKEAASYVGVSPAHFDRLVREGFMPRPTHLLGRKVWDVRALDRVLDNLNGLDPGAGPTTSDAVLDRELAAFEAKHGQH